MGDMEALRMGSVLEKEMSCLFPAPLQSLISSEEDLNTLRFCNQNGLSSTIRGGGTADPFSCLTAPSAQLQSPLAMACPMPQLMFSLIVDGLDQEPSTPLLILHTMLHPAVDHLSFCPCCLTPTPSLALPPTQDSWHHLFLLSPWLPFGHNSSPSFYPATSNCLDDV